MFEAIKRFFTKDKDKRNFVGDRRDRVTFSVPDQDLRRHTLVMGRTRDGMSRRHDSSQPDQSLLYMQQASLVSSSDSCGGSSSYDSCSSSSSSSSSDSGSSSSCGGGD